MVVLTDGDAPGAGSHVGCRGGEGGGSKVIKCVEIVKVEKCRGGAFHQRKSKGLGWGERTNNTQLVTTPVTYHRAESTDGCHLKKSLGNFHKSLHSNNYLCNLTSVKLTTQQRPCWGLKMASTSAMSLFENYIPTTIR